MAEKKTVPKLTIPLISCDFGYGITKIFNGVDDPLGIKSLVGDPIGLIKFQTKIKESKKKGKYDLDWISCRYPKTDKRYFIGELARRQSAHVYYITDQDKLSYDSTKALIDTGIALMLPETVKNKPIPLALNVVTGLPVSQYVKVQQEGLRKSLLGEHSIEFDWDRDNSFKHGYKFKINEISIIPQPVGTFYNIILDNKGDFLPEYETLASGNVALIDVGYGTTDLCVLKGIEYIEKSSRSSNTAMSSVFSYISSRLAEHSGIEIPVWKIEPVISGDSKEMLIRLEGKTYKLDNIYQQAIDAIFEELMAAAKGLWRTEHQIDTYIIMGGGAKPFAEKFKTTFGTKGSVIIADDPVFSNVKGYYKYGRRLFK